MCLKERKDQDQEKTRKDGTELKGALKVGSFTAKEI